MPDTWPCSAWPGCKGGGPSAPRPCTLQRVPKPGLARRRQRCCPYKGREQQKIAVSEHFLPPFRPWLQPRRTWPCCSRARKGSGSPLTPALPLLLLVLSPVLGPGGTEPSSWVNLPQGPASGTPRAWGEIWGGWCCSKQHPQHDGRDSIPQAGCGDPKEKSLDGKQHG